MSDPNVYQTVKAFYAIMNLASENTVTLDRVCSSGCRCGSCEDYVIIVDDGLDKTTHVLGETLEDAVKALVKLDPYND